MAIKITELIYIVSLQFCFNNRSRINSGFKSSTFVAVRFGSCIFMPWLRIYLICSVQVCPSPTDSIVQRQNKFRGFFLIVPQKFLQILQIKHKIRPQSLDEDSNSEGGEPAFAREGSLPPAEAQTGRFSDGDADAEHLGCASIKPSSSACAESRLEMQNAREKPPRRLQVGGIKRKKKWCTRKKQMKARQAGVTCASEATEEAYWPQVRWCGQAQRGGQRRQQHPCGRARCQKGCCLCPTDRHSSTGPRSPSGTGCLCPVRLLAGAKPPMSARGFVLHGAHLRWWHDVPGRCAQASGVLDT